MKHVINKANEAKRIINELIGYASTKDMINEGKIKPKFKGGVIRFNELIGKEASTKSNYEEDDVKLANKKPTKGSVKKLKNKNLYMGRFQYEGEVYYSYAKRFLDCFEKHEAKIKEVLTLQKQAQTKQTNGFNKYSLLKDWYNYWYNTYKEPFLRDSSKNSYKSLFNANLKDVDLLNKKLCKITTFDVQELINGIKALSSKRKVKTALKACFEKAIDTGVITFNPVRAVAKIPKPKTKRKKTLSNEEVKAILNYCKNSGKNTKENIYLEVRDLYILMLNTGLRIGEALALTWNDIDFEKELITINKSFDSKAKRLGKTKNIGSERKIPLFKNMKNLLSRKEKNENFIFKKLMDTKISDYSRMISSRINIKFTNHMFRHTFASNCIAKGINPKTVQKWLGHTKLDMTMNTYVGVVEKLEQSDIDKYNKKND